jgi:BirA family biotin operon repressor/biotin-[acetyl-CoA-carboxylase] ligase
LQTIYYPFANLEKMKKTGSFTPLPIDEKLRSLLEDLPLGDVRFFNQIDSTNREASVWASQGAPDLALVIANEQTAGKGRHRRSWFTPPDSALAFSLVLHQTKHEITQMDSSTSDENLAVRWTALGALAVCQALQEKYALKAEIKWPNDVLIWQRKAAGVLVEAHWNADQLRALILGIGINIAPLSAPPDELVSFPATCVEAAVGHPIQRFELLQAVIRNILAWRERLYEPVFIQTWESYLAFKGDRVVILESSPTQHTAQTGLLIGLDEHGRLRIRTSENEELRLVTGELTIRPLGKISNTGSP